MLRDKRSVYEGERDMLLRIFREVDDGSGDVDLKEFVALWRKFGVEVRGPPEPPSLAPWREGVVPCHVVRPVCGMATRCDGRR